MVLLPVKSNPAASEHLAFELSFKQSIAWDFLHDKVTIELLYGGGAGGGKSQLGCAFAIEMSLKYEGIRGLIGREALKDLKESTLLTFFDVCARMGLIEGADYTYNQQNNVITFLQTGSTIYLRELGWLPSDPNYDRLGSTEYTWAFIDEGNQVRQKAKNIVRSRLRYKITSNGLVPKLLITCNPSKGYLYSEFFKPAKEGKLDKTKQFLKALATDNPFIDPFYIQNLRGLDPESQERLLFGNWEYDGDPSTLVRYEALNDLFSNVVLIPRDADGKVLPSAKYIICDVARFGGDRTVLTYWEGLVCKRIAIYTKLPSTPPLKDDGTTLDWSKPSVAGKVKEWREFYGVPQSHVLLDEDGVGGGATDLLHCKGFMGGRSPFPMPRNHKMKQNYLNLRSQCYYKLVEHINTRTVAVSIDQPELRDLLVSELEQIKAKDHDKDGKLAIVPKDDIKEKIGRSPDLADTFMMRMFFEFAPKPTINWL